MSENNRIESERDTFVSSRNDEECMTTRAVAFERAQAFLRDRKPEGRLVSEELIAERRAEAVRE